MDLAFRLHAFNRESTNLGLLRQRDFQGFLITGQHSGTHWIKWMLSNAIADRYGVAPPAYYNNRSSNDLIGHPRHPRPHPNLPRLASTHTIAPYALDWRWLRAIAPLPPYAVVVRDIRDVLISNFEKWSGTRYHIDFSTYVRGDPTGRAYVCDVWWYIRFLNRWGEVARRFPGSTTVFRYEDFRRDPHAELDRLARAFSLGLAPGHIDVGVRAGTKEVMLAHHDPEVRERPVRADGSGQARFSAEDVKVLRAILDRRLRHRFGYDYDSDPVAWAA